MEPTDSTAPPRGASASLVSAAASLLALLVVAVISDVRFAPPSVQPASAPSDVFSAERARAHLDVIASAPRPVGSEHNRETRAYLVQVARELGLEVEVQSEAVVREMWGNPFPAATLHNVVARLPGTEGARAVLIMGHYDSIPTGPGAADNGVAVAAMLETMRVLATRAAPRNEVVFLFTDAEEVGGLGAEAFRELSWSEEYALILNFEARGSRGPSLLFETSQDNGRLVRAFAGAETKLFGNSLYYEVYRHMPVDTDFTVFKDVGALGMNFAFIHGFRDYHTANDRSARLDPRSLQHHGEYMLALTTSFADGELSNIREPNRIFFDVMGAWVIYYPESLAIPLAVATVLIALFAVRRAVRHGSARWRRVAATAGLTTILALATAGAALGLYLLALWIRPELQSLPLMEPYEREWYLAGFVALTLAGVATTGYLLAGSYAPVEVLAGVLVVFAALLTLSAFSVPGATYLFQWPLVFGAPALWHLARRDAAPLAARSRAILWLGPAVAAVLFVPLIDSLFAGLGVLLAPVPVLLSAFAASLALPLALHRRALGWTALVAAAAALGVVIGAAALSDFDRQEPRQNSLVYVQDQTLGEAWWVSTDYAVDEWTAQALGDAPSKARVDDYFPVFHEPIWRAPADDLGLPAPSAEVLEERVEAQARVLRVRIGSRREGASLLQVQVTGGAPVRAISVGGERLDAEALARQGEGAEGEVFHYWAPPPSGVEFVFEVERGAALTIRVCDVSYGFPDKVRAALHPRSDDEAVAAFGWALTDAALVSASFEL